MCKDYIVLIFGVSKTTTMKTLNNTTLRNLCTDLLLNGNRFTTQFDNELRRMRELLDGSLGQTSEDLKGEDLDLLESLCLNSERGLELRMLRNNK